MADIPARVREMTSSPRPDFRAFAEMITGGARPQRVHFAELFADAEIMQFVTESIFGKPWHAAGVDRASQERNLLCQIEYWHRMGYDYIRVGGGVDFEFKMLQGEDTADLTRGQREWADGHAARIASREDFDKFPWPACTDESLWPYRFVAENLPQGMAIMGCPTWGFFEVATDLLIGYETLCLMIHDEPELVEAFFQRVGGIICDACEKIVALPRVEGFFQGDDMGFRSGTLVRPEFLRRHILPQHKRVAEICHRTNKLYFLHSCGQLEAIMEDLIADVRVDAKHSYEDTITPVEEIARQYGQRVGVLGGVPVDLLARGSEADVRRRTREILNACMPIGRYALGSGNTVANYVRPENFMAMLDEGLAFRV